jgi:hypothetical protein
MAPTERLRQIATRLSEIATALGDESLEDARAVELAGAARLTEEAVGETESEVARVESEE